MSKFNRNTVCQNVDKDVAVLTDAGRPFQIRNAATKNARLPSVELMVMLIINIC